MAAAPVGGAAAAADEKVRLQLFFRAEGLMDKDTTSKSDPYLLLTQRTDRGGTIPIGKTEIIKNDLNPKWKVGFAVDFFFEMKQEFMVSIYDDDGKGPAGDDALGQAVFQLAHVVGSQGARGGFKTKIAGGDGFIFIVSQEVSQSKRDTVVMQFAGRELRKMDTFGQSDPYFRLLRVNPNGTSSQIYLSKVIPKTLEPVWDVCPTFKISELTGTDRNAKTLRFEMFDKDMFKDDSMGWFDFSFNDLLEVGAGRKTFEPRKPHKPDNRYGTIFLKQFRVNTVPTFLDYLRGGMQMNLMVSIDFTGSNGDPAQPTSLHYMNPVQPNQYVRAIMSVGDILMEYDTDKQVPAFGFGARLPDGNVNMCFHLNFEQNPYVPGVQGVLDCYGRALASVRLSGPTNFAPTIATANRLSRSSPGVYTVLLILTDGDITDMGDTVNAICGCDDAPLSIVIVGVGNGCDFALMDQLDADKVPLQNSQGRTCRRDLVQFVPFRNFGNAPPAALAAEVLREIPDQVVDWAILTKYTAPLQQAAASMAPVAGTAPVCAPAA